MSTALKNVEDICRAAALASLPLPFQISKQKNQTFVVTYQLDVVSLH